GHGRIISDKDATLQVLEDTILQYEPSYGAQWGQFPEDYKSRMLNGIVAFEIVVNELQAKKKLSQNRSDAEIAKIIHTLSKRDDHNEQIIADYMRTSSRSF